MTQANTFRAHLNIHFLGLFIKTLVTNIALPSVLTVSSLSHFFALKQTPFFKTYYAVCNWKSGRCMRSK